MTTIFLGKTVEDGNRTHANKVTIYYSATKLPPAILTGDRTRTYIYSFGNYCSTS